MLGDFRICLTNVIVDKKIFLETVLCPAAKTNSSKGTYNENYVNDMILIQLGQLYSAYTIKKDLPFFLHYLTMPSKAEKKSEILTKY